MEIRLHNVRLSFPHLFKPQASKDGAGDPKYGASFLILKEAQADQIKMIRDAMIAVAKAQWPAGIPQSVKGEKVCLRDGTTKDYDGYNDKIEFLSASSVTRPTVVDRDRTVLTAEDGKPYAGCFVNAIVRLWAQDNQYGKRINAQLKAVQFCGDGDPFGEKATSPDEFEDLENKQPQSAPKMAANDPALTPEVDEIPF